MKYLMIALLLFGAVLVAGCASGYDSRGARVQWPAARGLPESSSSGGIDPIAMAGIEASNAATEAQAQAQSQAAIDQISRDAQAAAAASAAAANQ